MSFPALPPAIAGYIDATNAGDSAVLLATFADDALVNDIQREFWGKSEIKAFTDKEIFGANVTMEVTKIVEHHGDFAVWAKLDGTYDKTGLPDPLILTFYFTHRDGKITTLIILHNKPAG